ncbi:MAG TPA: PSD1 and planctomycete cytochrome C domain-containing protein [Blastocatellia bacterium]|nr:PSD1 and planctomycete cytochrome C domain-containing protein [Blastocatellia bacterium]
MLRRYLKLGALIVGFCALLILLGSLQTSAVYDARDEFFESRIRPVLAMNCYDCHTDAAKGGLRVDSREALLKGGQRGPAIIVGKPEESLLIKAVKHETLQMPKGGAKLKENEIADLSQWIKDGAYWPATAAVKNDYLIKPEHKAFWSFQPVRNPTIPTVKGQTNNAVDAFLLAKLEANNLTFNTPADKRTLIRRATFDLTGLPPTPEEVAAFIADKAPDAFAKVVDRLLASPTYGERWGRHWLDVARYSDTVGMVDAGRNTQGWFPYAYTYRDWVIEAFNKDLPYDQFIVQQLAADKLPNNDPRNLAALGFVTLSRGGLGVNQQEKIDDKIDVATRGLMGLTVACARCHNHKFDPIPTKDYYSLYTIFNNSREPKSLPLLDPKADLTKWDEEMNAEEKKVETEVAKLRESRYPKLKELYRTAPEVAKSLRSVYEARALTKDEEVDKFAREKDYNAYMLKRWRAYLQKVGEDSVWTIWHKLAAIPEKEFATKAASILAGIDTNKLHPLVAQAFKDAPSSMRDVAEAYGKLLAKYDKAEPLKDANEEALRQILHGTDSPISFPFSDYDSVRLSVDKQNEDGKRTPLESLRLRQAYRGAPSRAQAVEDVPEPKPGHVFLRGKPENKGDEVHPQFLLILAGEKRQRFTNGSGRLELARAIADKNNPLTARVLVNRVWARHFGQGLVRTPSDFGTRGDTPTHPELLDYLASDFVANGWSIKKLHRTLMLSRAYQQSSSYTPQSAINNPQSLDPENKWLWRMNRRRLDFEELRDALLATSGKLDRTMGGLPASAMAWPYLQRRTIYAFIDRALVPNDFRVFDFASPDAHSPQRYLTTVPQQALLLMNSPFVIKQAKALLQRPEIAAVQNARLRITKLYRLLYGRAPSAEEIALGLKFISTTESTENTERTQKASATFANPSILQSAIRNPQSAKCDDWQYGQGEYDDKAERVKTFKPFAWFLEGEWRNTPIPGDPRESVAWLNSKGGFTYEGKAKVLTRRWTAPFDGKVAISGTLEQTFENGCRKCEGVQGIIVSSRTGKAGNWIAVPTKTETSVKEIVVQRGDTLDFIADASKGGGGNSFKWDVTIKRLDGSSEDWNSSRDFRNPAVNVMSAWERYAQTLFAAAEFLILD